MVVTNIIQRNSCSVIEVLLKSCFRQRYVVISGGFQYGDIISSSSL